MKKKEKKEEEKVYKLRNEMAIPYVMNFTSSNDMSEFILSMADEVEDYYTSWGIAIEKLWEVYNKVLNSVLWANELLVQISGHGDMLLVDPKWEMHSPAIDWNHIKDGDMESINSVEREAYYFQLERIMSEELPGIGGCDQAGTEAIITFPYSYDRWLQVALVCDDEKKYLPLVFPERYLKK